MQAPPPSQGRNDSKKAMGSIIAAVRISAWREIEDIMMGCVARAEKRKIKPIYVAAESASGMSLPWMRKRGQLTPVPEPSRIQQCLAEERRDSAQRIQCTTHLKLYMANK